ncbi:hypothetical protein B0T14DRAFT_225727 [Immersiella caudata]|uniref:Uncharacterized protein n=1 Tax=Immersiella caudata TaxID=314043 RepID=A0AA39WRE2_9PEZI|nr:hypothetical protein B0T14DRAFT_225727 [Immersiella caudata]
MGAGGGSDIGVYIEELRYSHLYTDFATMGWKGHGGGEEEGEGEGEEEEKRRGGWDRPDILKDSLPCGIWIWIRARDPDEEDVFGLDFVLFGSFLAWIPFGLVLGLSCLLLEFVIVWSGCFLFAWIELPRVFICPVLVVQLGSLSVCLTCWLG